MPILFFHVENFPCSKEQFSSQIGKEQFSSQIHSCDPEVHHEMHVIRYRSTIPSRHQKSKHHSHDDDDDDDNNKQNKSNNQNGYTNNIVPHCLIKSN